MKRAATNIVERRSHSIPRSLGPGWVGELRRGDLLEVFGSPEGSRCAGADFCVSILLFEPEWGIAVFL